MPNQEMSQRVIVHVDLDCFFASVEILDHPDYKGVPLIVGADPKQGKGRGVISTCSYEARSFGLHSGMPISHAFQNCPHGIYVKPHFHRYKEISQQVMQIIQSYSSIFEQVGIDEAYIDLSEKVKDLNEAHQMALKIKKQVQNEVGVTCSIGIAPTKSWAKIGSDYRKPNGITIITHNNYSHLLSKLKITAIPGIGKKTKKYYENQGINTIGDLIRTPLSKISQIFGQTGTWAWNIAHGFDERAVHDSSYTYHRKSISKERTFNQDTGNIEEIIAKFVELNDRLHSEMTKKNVYYKTISIKVRFEGFLTYTRALSLKLPIRNAQNALKIALSLFDEFTLNPKKIRLIGLRFSNLNDKNLSNQKDLTYFISNNQQIIQSLN